MLELKGNISCVKLKLLKQIKCILSLKEILEIFRIWNISPNSFPFLSNIVSVQHSVVCLSKRKVFFNPCCKARRGHNIHWCPNFSAGVAQLGRRLIEGGRPQLALVVPPPPVSEPQSLLRTPGSSCSPAATSLPTFLTHTYLPTTSLFFLLKPRYQSCVSMPYQVCLGLHVLLQQGQYNPSKKCHDWGLFSRPVSTSGCPGVIEYFTKAGGGVNSYFINHQASAFI